MPGPFGEYWRKSFGRPVCFVSQMVFGKEGWGRPAESGGFWLVLVLMLMLMSESPP